MLIILNYDNHSSILIIYVKAYNAKVVCRRAWQGSARKKAAPFWLKGLPFQCGAGYPRRPPGPIFPPRPVPLGFPGTPLCGMGAGRAPLVGGTGAGRTVGRGVGAVAGL